VIATPNGTSILDLVEAAEKRPDDAQDALDAFIKAHGSPVVDEQGATFLYDDGGASQEVHLVNWVFGLESRQALRRIPNTTGWYLTVDLPKGSRVEYKLEIVRNGRSKWIKDPANPHLAYDPFGANSVCRMYGYADPDWVFPEPGVRRGRIESTSLRSRVWGQEREVQLYLPAEYKPHKRYPLLVCFDGNDYQRFAGIHAVLDNLIQRREMRPLIVAFTSGVSRNEEYAANPRQAKFVVEEILPHVARVAGVSDSPKDRGLLGASFGAVTSLHTAWSYPGTFSRLFLQSGSFIFTDVGKHDKGALWDPVVQFVNAYRRDPARVDAKMMMTCGVFERLIYYNRSLVPLIRKVNPDLRYVEGHDGHNWVGWRDHLRDGLAWLYPGHLWMTYD
jgi:enterochelin esterase-like enzyme